MQVTCDQCNQVTKVNYVEVYMPDGLKATSFHCQHCQHQYVCFVTDRGVRDMQKVRDNLRGDKYIDERLRLQEDINGRMVVLKHEYAGT